MIHGLLHFYVNYIVPFDYNIVTHQFSRFPYYNSWEQYTIMGKFYVLINVLRAYYVPLYIFCMEIVIHACVYQCMCNKKSYLYVIVSLYVTFTATADWNWSWDYVCYFFTLQKKVPKRTGYSHNTFNLRTVIFYRRNTILSSLSNYTFPNSQIGASNTLMSLLSVLASDINTVPNYYRQYHPFFFTAVCCHLFADVPNCDFLLFDLADSRW